MTMAEYLSTKFFYIIDINSVMSQESSTTEDMNLQLSVQFANDPAQNVNINCYVLCSRVILGDSVVRVEN
jgi:hypothetical protein